ncbi:NAD-dependent epimerase/dehydratase family protein [Bradyrhizobium sp.]|uniref:NAD-dependent epimerase/dehydratase family protein n=1 Tax=Bradyrhizobium sp. TaxID=376 RepID=UPI000A6EF5D0|nr:NAD-dependent epimerase/dehydratase family protein [Bradyrhizobium sp.]
MRLFILGGTGSIGSAVVQASIRRGHEVLALARSDVAAAWLGEAGATPVLGDMAAPEPWALRLPPLDAVIHTACDFSTAMGEIDRRLLAVLLPALATQPKRPRFIYTGGGWLFGATGNNIATESTPFRPLSAFRWMVPNLTRILEAPEVDGIVIHPAMVYAGDGGVFQRLARDAIERDAVRVVESESVRWPLVHSDDLAVLYALALEGAPARSSYIGAAVDGLAIGRIARALARRYGTRRLEPQVIPANAIVAELGEWARGYALDQQLSGAKARRALGWAPKHLDPEGEIAGLP